MIGLGRPREGGPSAELASGSLAPSSALHSHILCLIISSLGPKLRLLEEARGQEEGPHVLC